MNRLASLLLGLLFASPSPAQDHPTRPIRFITAAAQGGTSDILARTFAVHLTKALKQPVVVFVADGSEPAGTTPEEFRQFMLADLAKWAKLVKESGAKLD